jgi:hypothetical protein
MRVGTRAAATKIVAAIIFPTTTSRLVTGMVSRISMDPLCLSSEKARMVMAGTNMANMSGRSWRKFLISACLR